MGPELGYKSRISGVRCGGFGHEGPEVELHKLSVLPHDFRA